MERCASSLFLSQRRRLVAALVTTWVCSAALHVETIAQDIRPLTEAERDALDAGEGELQKALAMLHGRAGSDIADAAIFQKGVNWARQYDRAFTLADVALLQNAIRQGIERANLLAAGKHPWRERAGRNALAYVSQVDGSVQPYGVIVPKSYNPATPIRLDVVLHGSTRPVGMSELRFMARFDEGDGKNAAPDDQPFIELHPLGLSRHYARAQLSARLNGDAVEIDEPQNITRFAILTSQLSRIPMTLRVGTTELVVPDSLTAKSKGIVVERRDDAWHVAGELGRVPLSGKRPGLQGPIDDAFTSPFVCVRGTGQPWNASVQAYADAALTRFADEWRHYFRGELPIKNDTEVTSEDVKTRNLILFGDPGSNLWIAKILPHLPLAWSKESLAMPSPVAGSRTNTDSTFQNYPAVTHVPAMIAPNPLPGAGDHYIVLNTGHTFHEAELGKINYLLFPRWGDWAVLKIDPAQSPSNPVGETDESAGYFDEQWRFPGHPE